MSTIPIIAMLGAMALAGLIYDFFPLVRRPLVVGAGAILFVLLAATIVCATLVSAPAPAGTFDAYALTTGVLASSVLSGSAFVRGVLTAARLEEPLAASLPSSRWIGYIERLGYTAALLLGLREVAAILIGVKALGQYSTRPAQGVDNRVAAARVIGTLSSVIWATGCYAVAALSMS